MYAIIMEAIPEVIETSELFFTKLSENATAPIKTSEFAAGFDLASANNCSVPAYGKIICETDLAIKVPSGTYGRIAPRSGLAIKHFITIGAGVIDPDFRGNVTVVLFNHSKSKFYIEKGDRIAQLICEKFESPNVREVTGFAPTSRGHKGFGSSGIDIVFE